MSLDRTPPPGGATESVQPQPAKLPTTTSEPDPIPIADDVCEILFHGDPRAQIGPLIALLRSAGAALDGVFAEVERRGALGRLLPDSPSPATAPLLDALLFGLSHSDGFVLLARAFIARRTDYARVAVNHLVDRANDRGVLPAVLERIIKAALYEPLVALMTSDGTSDSPMLRALGAARPTWSQDALNARAIAAIASHGTGPGPFSADLLIVPGFTPIDTQRPLALADIPAARARLDLALSDWNAKRAPYVFVTGAAVHPPGTPFNEGIMMRDCLVAHGVPEDRLLVDPHARHSTTNLRNAGRFMLRLGLKNALVVTGTESPVFDQAFYFGHPTLSSFNARCQAELGYLVGELEDAGDHRIAFSPSPSVATENWRDPIDH